MATPFKMKGFSGFKESPAKQEDFTKTGQRKYVKYNSAGNRIDMMGSEHTTKARANKNTIGSPKKTVKSKLPKNFNITGTSKASKIAQYLGKGSKFLGGKALGVAGMMMATSSKADQPKGKAKKKGSYTDDFTKKK
tara:strand:+ start:281 stop:688 length:408 start_codon:yes stop_codon:yes gene_type:complete